MFFCKSIKVLQVILLVKYGDLINLDLLKDFEIIISKSIKIILIIYLDILALCSSRSDIVKDRKTEVFVGIRSRFFDGIFCYDYSKIALGRLNVAIVQ